MQSRDIQVILIEEDEHLHGLIALRLKLTTQKLSSRYHFNFPIVDLYDYKDSHAFLKSQPKQKNSQAYLILDFDGSFGESGAYLIEVACEKFRDIRIILMAGSKNSILKIKQVFDIHDVYDYVIRDEYAPAVCALLFEQYIEKVV